MSLSAQVFPSAACAQIIDGALRYTKMIRDRLLRPSVTPQFEDALRLSLGELVRRTAWFWRHVGDVPPRFPGQNGGNCLLRDLKALGDIIVTLPLFRKAQDFKN